MLVWKARAEVFHCLKEVISKEYSKGLLFSNTSVWTGWVSFAAFLGRPYLDRLHGGVKFLKVESHLSHF